MKTLLLIATIVIGTAATAPAQEAVQRHLGGRSLLLSPIQNGKLPLIVAQQAVGMPNGAQSYSGQNTGGTWTFTQSSSQMPGWMSWFMPFVKAVGGMFDNNRDPWAGVGPGSVPGKFGPKNP